MSVVHTPKVCLVRKGSTPNLEPSGADVRRAPGGLLCRGGLELSTPVTGTRLTERITFSVSLYGTTVTTVHWAIKNIWGVTDMAKGHSPHA